MVEDSGVYEHGMYGRVSLKSLHIMPNKHLSFTHTSQTDGQTINHKWWHRLKHKWLYRCTSYSYGSNSKWLGLARFFYLICFSHTSNLILNQYIPCVHPPGCEFQVTNLHAHTGTAGSLKLQVAGSQMLPCKHHKPVLCTWFYLNK